MELLDPNERMDAERLRAMSTAELVRTALDEARMLARAEVLHAKAELRDELRRAKISGILFGAAMPLALAGLTLLFASLALALPLSAPLGALVVGLALLLIAGALGFAGAKKVPKKPMQHTQSRLKDDLALTREQLA